MSVSVIIPCYNEESCLEDCLTSITRQTLQGYEVIVVDDGSTDASRDIAARYPVKLIQASHGGPAAARNLGARQSRGDILVFVDADMAFDEAYLERLVGPIQEGATVATFHQVERVANPDNVWAHCWTLHSGLAEGVRLPSDQPAHSTVFRAVLRSVFEQAGGYADMGYEDDTSISERLGGVMAMAAEGAICWHHNPSSMRDVFLSARWIGRGMQQVPRRVLMAAMLPLSLLKGLRGAMRYRQAAYLPFRLLYDCGLLCGILMRHLGMGHMK